VDDDEAVRNSLRFLVESSGMKAVTYANAGEFLRAYQSNQAGCLVLDVRLPGMGGLDLQQQLAASGVRIPVIIVTGYGDVPNAVLAMRHGALDFIEKPYDDKLMLDRIEKALALDQQRRCDHAVRQEVAARIAALTAREREVMELVVNGLPNKQIASSLGISTKTVEAHRARVMEKMRADSMAGLVRLVQDANDRADRHPSQEEPATRPSRSAP